MSNNKESKEKYVNGKGKINIEEKGYEKIISN